MTTQILICGGRNYGEYLNGVPVDYLMRKRVRVERKFFLDTVEAYYKVFDKDVFIIEGGARGADRLAKSWRMKRGIPGKTFPADWKKYGKSAGYKRNREMLIRGRPDIVIAFPGGTGTNMMCDIAYEDGVEVVRMNSPFRG